ncbi:MAG: LytR/AlgR family response regulator transcription factor [Sphingobacteriales bacterium]
MNLTCYIVDDEFHAIEVLKAYIEKTPGLVLQGYTTDPLVALKDIAGPDAPQVTFADVDMPELSGMEFAGMVSLYTKVVFTTSFPEYAIEAFEKEAFDYVLKPVSYERFLRTIVKLKKHFQAIAPGADTPKDYFYIKSDIKGKMIRIIVEDIIYVEAAQNYIRIHLVSGKHMAYLTMEEIAERLPGSRFTRIHRSFIINNNRIKTLENGQVTLDDRSVISLGRFYRNPFLASMKELLVQSKRTTG